MSVARDSTVSLSIPPARSCRLDPAAHLLSPRKTNRKVIVREQKRL